MPQYSDDNQIAEESYRELMNDNVNAITPAALFGRLNREEQAGVLEAAILGLRSYEILDMLHLTYEEAWQLAAKLESYTQQA